MYSYSLLALAASLASVSATTYQGFNYGTTFTDGSAKQVADFEAEFKNAQGLEGTNGAFTSARLYTMIQAGTASDPTSAIQAAINTKTTLLLGLWASGGQAGIDSELAALTAAIKQYGQDFSGVVAAISVGSEDLYRITPTGIENNAGIGAGPADLTSYINQTRNAIAGTALEGALIGHVDTWTAFVNGSNAAVIEACDFLGVDAYPYFQTTDANAIDNGQSVFFDAYYATVGAAQGKPVWITETGWPVSGATSGQAVASIANAKTYWDEVGCESFGNVNVYWYTMQDAEPTTPSPSFGVVGSTLSTTPLFDLTCPSGAKFPTAAPSQVAAASSTASGSSTQVSNSAAPYPSGPTGSGSSTTPTAASGASSTTSTGAAVAPTVRLAGLGMGVVAVGAALML